MKQSSAPARVWIEVDKNALRGNIQILRKASDGMYFRAVLKADAYGLGAEPIAAILKEEGVNAFCVAEFQEALPLLRFGLPIQILGAIFDFELPEAVANHIILPVSSIESAERISAEAARQNTTAECQFKLDTGMGRMGILAEHAPDVIRYVLGLPHLRCTGIYSHFPAAAPDGESADFSRRQMARFLRVVENLKRTGIEFEHLHMANTDAFTSFPEVRTPPFTGVRTGLCMYGICSAAAQKFGLKNAVSLYSRLAAFRVLPAGYSVGYNRTCILKRDTLVGTVSIGYADGLPLQLSNRGEMLFHGKRCPILGRISMDYTTISLDGFTTDDLKFGEPVTCIGSDGGNEITMEDWADLANTHAYEILTSLNPRVKRLYV